MRFAQTVVAAALAVASLSGLSACGDESTASGALPASEAAPSVCSHESGAGVDLDVPGPGKPTPEEAVAPYLDAYVVTNVEEHQRSATLRAETAGGAVRLFNLTRRNDGWWPEGYAECASR